MPASGRRRRLSDDLDGALVIKPSGVRRRSLLICRTPRGVVPYALDRELTTVNERLEGVVDGRTGRGPRQSGGPAARVYGAGDRRGPGDVPRVSPGRVHVAAAAGARRQRAGDGRTP